MRFISISISNDKGRASHFIIINAAHIVAIHRNSGNGSRIDMTDGATYDCEEIPSEIIDQIDQKKSKELTS